MTDFIEGLPLANTPEVFGLHPNAEIGYYTNAAKEMWSHLVELQPQTGMHLQILQVIKLPKKPRIFFLKLETKEPAQKFSLNILNQNVLKPCRSTVFH